MPGGAAGGGLCWQGENPPQTPVTHVGPRPSSVPPLTLILEACLTMPSHRLCPHLPWGPPPHPQPQTGSSNPSSS